MKIYFSRIIADHWCSKNQLQKEAHTLAHNMERRIVTEPEVLNFKAEFIDGIAKINAAHHRCNPLHLSINNSVSGNGDIIFWCDGVFNLELILAV
jgi:hypothetical protein